MPIKRGSKSSRFKSKKMYTDCDAIFIDTLGGANTIHKKESEKKTLLFMSLETRIRLCIVIVLDDSDASLS